MLWAATTVSSRHCPTTLTKRSVILFEGVGVDPPCGFCGIKSVNGDTSAIGNDIEPLDDMVLTADESEASVSERAKS